MKNKYQNKLSIWSIILFFNAFFSLFLMALSLYLDEKSMLIVGYFSLPFLAFAFISCIITIYYFIKYCNS